MKNIIESLLGGKKKKYKGPTPEEEALARELTLERLHAPEPERGVLPQESEANILRRKKLDELNTKLKDLEKDIIDLSTSLGLRETRLAEDGIRLKALHEEKEAIKKEIRVYTL